MTIEYSTGIRPGLFCMGCTQRPVAAEKILKESPSLKPIIEQAIADEYPNARADAVDETGLRDDLFPVACPYLAANLLSHDFWPDQP